MLGIGGDTRTLNVERLRAADVGIAGTRQRCRSAGLCHATARARTLRRAALLAGVSCAALAVLAPGAIYAQDATWIGPGTEWTDDANWDPNGVPGNTATFTGNTPTSVNISNDAEIATMQFTAAAPAYSFVISSAFSIMGIDNSSAFAPSFLLNS